MTVHVRDDEIKTCTKPGETPAFFCRSMSALGTPAPDGSARDCASAALSHHVAGAAFGRYPRLASTGQASPAVPGRSADGAGLRP